MSVASVLSGEASWEVVENDCRAELSSWPESSVHCVVTSPPYFGLRDYGVAGQIGLEPTPEEYVAEMVAVFREVRRVLRDDGTLWLNLGDSYWTAKGTPGGEHARIPDAKNEARRFGMRPTDRPAPAGSGIKPKDLIGIPWMVAFALRADGWYLRADIVWAKSAPMPESVRDRPTRSHEFVFLLTKSARYWYDADAVREPATYGNHSRNVVGDVASGVPDGHPHRGIRGHGLTRTDKQRGHGRRHEGFNGRWDAMSREEQRAMGRNLRDVWTLGPDPYPGDHFAVMPRELAERCIKAGCPAGGVVLDPFAGHGTTGVMARRLGRRFVGIELSHAYVRAARERIRTDAPLLNDLPPAEPITVDDSQGGLFDEIDHAPMVAQGDGA